MNHNSHHSHPRKQSKRATEKEPDLNKIDFVSKHDMNPSLNEMKYRLDIYKNEVNEGIENDKPIENENFKKNFYTALENLLNQIVFIKDRKLRAQKIETIHKWFQAKMSFFHTLNTINTRTSKSHYENYPDFDGNLKTTNYEAENYPLHFERDHRTEDDSLLPPKDR